jgi:hypothetical protein
MPTGGMETLIASSGSLEAKGHMNAKKLFKIWTCYLNALKQLRGEPSIQTINAHSHLTSTNVCNDIVSEDEA